MTFNNVGIFEKVCYREVINYLEEQLIANLLKVLRDQDHDFAKLNQLDHTG